MATSTAAPPKNPALPATQVNANGFASAVPLGRKVNSSAKETYVTNLLVLDPQNSGGANYAVEVWQDKPHQVAPMSGIALTVIGVVNKSGGVPPWARDTSYSRLYE